MARAAATRAATSAEPSAGGGRARSAELDRRHVDAEIDAVEQRARELALVVEAAARRAAAGAAGLHQMAAAAGVHRRHELEARRIGDMGIGARHRHAARFQRLAQRLERGAIELRQLVEEQHAVMGERDLARPGAQAAADQRLQGRRMVRIAEGAAAARACLRRGRPPASAPWTLPAPRRARAAAGCRAGAPPASTCPSRAGRSSGDCGRRPPPARARAWRSPGP